MILLLGLTSRPQGVRPAVPFRSLSKGDDVTWGFLEGVMNLPVDGRWLVARCRRAHARTRTPTRTHVRALLLLTREPP